MGVGRMTGPEDTQPEMTMSIATPRKSSKPAASGHWTPTLDKVLVELQSGGRPTVVGLLAMADAIDAAVTILGEQDPGADPIAIASHNRRLHDLTEVARDMRTAARKIDPTA